jgi:hypothetical protein
LHVLISLWILLASWRWGDWKNFKLYYPTMLYIALSNFLYHFFADEYFHLWAFEPDMFIKHPVTFIVHSFIINPFSVFLFLSNYPSMIKSQILHTLKWIFLFLIVEWIGYKLGTIVYFNGWNFWWSVLFIIVMFPMLRLHYVKPLLAIFLLVLCTLVHLWIFDYI